MKLEKIPHWVDNDCILSGEKFKKIFIYFVIQVPIPEKSARAFQIQENLSIPIKYRMVEKASDMDNYLDKHDLIQFPPKANYEERSVFTRSQSTVLLSFVDHIRNSIAHGRFNIERIGKEDYLIIEDINKHSMCSARIVICISTLTKWIDKQCVIKRVL